MKLFIYAFIVSFTLSLVLLACTLNPPSGVYRFSERERHEAKHEFLSRKVNHLQEQIYELRDQLQQQEKTIEQLEEELNPPKVKHWTDNVDHKFFGEILSSTYEAVLDENDIFYGKPDPEIWRDLMSQNELEKQDD